MAIRLKSYGSSKTVTVTPSETEQRFVAIESQGNAVASQVQDAAVAAGSAVASAQQTQRYLFIGGGIVAVVLAIIAFKKL